MLIRAYQMPMAANVLSMLTRLRQLVLHPSLVPANYLEVSSRLRYGETDWLIMGL